jgi:Skp family chaperone for outer membrane proteins
VASTELAGLDQAMTNQQQRLQAEAGVLSANARLELEQRVEREALDFQRSVEDKQAELAALQDEVAGAFRARLIPAVAAVAAPTGVHFIFDRATAPIAWADPAYDVTDRVIEQIDAN